MILNITNLPTECSIKDVDYSISESFRTIYFMPKDTSGEKIYFSIQKEIEDGEVLITRYIGAKNEHVFRVHKKSFEVLGLKFIISSLSNSKI